MELDQTSKALAIGVLLIGILSMGYTYSISQGLEDFQTEDEVLDTIGEQQQEIVDQFNEEIEGIDEDISDLSDRVDGNEDNISSNQEDIDEVDERTENVSELEETVEEMDEYLEEIASVDIVEEKDYPNFYEVAVKNEHRQEAEVTVSVEWDDGSNSQTESVDSMEESTFTINKPSVDENETLGEPETEVSYELPE